MQFDYLSLTEENKKKWKQSVEIAVIIGLLFYLDIIGVIAQKITFK